MRRRKFMNWKLWRSERKHIIFLEVWDPSEPSAFTWPKSLRFPLLSLAPLLKPLQIPDPRVTFTWTEKGLGFSFGIWDCPTSLNNTIPKLNKMAYGCSHTRGLSSVWVCVCVLECFHTSSHCKSWLLPFKECFYLKKKN